jgi:hypothetical protein
MTKTQTTSITMRIATTTRGWTMTRTLVGVFGRGAKW